MSLLVRMSAGMKHTTGWKPIKWPERPRFASVTFPSCCLSAEPKRRGDGIVSGVKYGIYQHNLEPEAGSLRSLEPNYRVRAVKRVFRISGGDTHTHTHVIYDAIVML